MLMQDESKLECSMYANKFKRCIFLEYYVVIKSLVMLKCECKTSLHAVQYK